MKRRRSSLQKAIEALKCDDQFSSPMQTPFTESYFSAFSPQQMQTFDDASCSTTRLRSEFLHGELPQVTGTNSYIEVEAPLQGQFMETTAYLRQEFQDLHNSKPTDQFQRSNHAKLNQGKTCTSGLSSGADAMHQNTQFVEFRLEDFLFPQPQVYTEHNPYTAASSSSTTQPAKMQTQNVASPRSEIVDLTADIPSTSKSPVAEKSPWHALKRSRNNAACKESRKKMKCKRDWLNDQVYQLTKENETLRRLVLELEVKVDAAKKSFFRSVNKGKK